MVCYSIDYTCVTVYLITIVKVVHIIVLVHEFGISDKLYLDIGASIVYWLCIRYSVLYYYCLLLYAGIIILLYVNYSELYYYEFGIFDETIFGY